MSSRAERNTGPETYRRLFSTKHGCVCVCLASQGFDMYVLWLAIYIAKNGCTEQLAV